MVVKKFDNLCNRMRSFIALTFPFSAATKINCIGLIAPNGWHMACGGFEAFSYQPRTKLATKRKPYRQPFTSHELYAVLWAGFIQLEVLHSMLRLIYP